MRISSLLTLLFVLCHFCSGAQVVDVKFSSASTSSHDTLTSFVAGEVIFLDVDFDSAPGTPTSNSTLQLSVGRPTNDAYAYYDSVPSANTVTYKYIVRDGDNSSDLDYSDRNALAGISFNGLLPIPGTTGSLGQTSAIVVDTAPLVRSVRTSLASGTYGTGQIVPVIVQFSEQVFLSPANSTTKLLLQLSGNTVNATYVSGSSSNELTFNYTITAGQSTTSLDYQSTNALSLGSGVTLQDKASAGKTATLTLPATGTSTSLQDIKVDAIAPTVSSISSSAANGTYKFGDIIPITIQFSEPVVVSSGTPTLALDSNGTATYVSGSGLANLNFTYTVQNGDISSDLDSASTSALSGNIFDVAGNPGVLTTPHGSATSGALASNKTIAIAVPPTVTLVSGLPTPSTGPLGIGNYVDISVTLSGTPIISGSGATLTLETGAIDRTAIMTSGTANPMVFRYTVQAGDNALVLDYLNNNALSLGSVTLNGLSGLSLTLPAVGSTSLSSSAIQIDTTTAGSPTFTVTPAANPSSTQPISATITASEVVTGFDGNDLALAKATATFSGSGQNYSAILTPVSDLYEGVSVSAGVSLLKLRARTAPVSLTKDQPLQIGSTTVFVGTAIIVQLTTTDVYLNDPVPIPVNINTSVWGPTGVTMALAIPANAAQDLAGNQSIAFTSTSVVYDPTPPIATVTPPGGSPLNFTVTFSEGVSALTSSHLTVSGGTIGTISGSSPTWTVPVTPTGSGNVSLSVNANAVVDQAGNANPASNTGTFSPLTATQIVAATTPALLKAGDSADITVTLSRSVILSAGGTPKLSLATGTSPTQVSLSLPASLPATTNSLTFHYTVSANQNSIDLDVAGINALDLGGCTLDGLTSINLPAPGATGSLSATSAVVVDTVVPSVTMPVASTVGTSPTSLTVTFSEAIASGSLASTDFTSPTSGVSFGTPVVAGDYRSATVPVTLPIPSVATPYTITFSGSANDTAGNPSSVHPSTTITYDPTPPVLTITPPTTDRSTSPINVTITSTKAVTGLSTSGLTVTNGTASTVNGSGSSFNVDLTPLAPLVLDQAAAIGVSSIRLRAASTAVDLPAGTVILVGTTVMRLASTATTTVTSAGAVVPIEGTLTAAITANTATWPARGQVVGLTVNAGACQDSSSQTNAAVGPSNVRYDPTPPMFRVTAPTAVQPNGLAVYTLTPSESVAGLTATSFTVTGATITSVTESTDRATWTVAVAPTSTANLSLALAAGAAVDGAGNASLVVAPVTFAVAPHVTSVAAVNADGTYGAGLRLQVKVTFSEAVTVSGTPTLALALVSGGRQAAYTGGSGSTALLFDYSIVTGDTSSDLDYTSTTALLASGATIRDSDGNDASLTLATPGASGSLGADAAIVVNTVTPDNPAKPDINGQQAGGGCGAGSGIALILAGGWLGLSLRRRRAA